MRHDRGIELLAEFAAHLGDAALRVFGELQRLRPVLHRVHRLARLVFEVAQQAIDLLFQLAEFFALLFFALLFEMVALARQLLLSRAQRQPFRVDLAQLFMQAIEEARDVVGLRTSVSRGLR